MPELDRERGSNFRKLRILEREWRGRFGPNQEVQLFRCRSKTDSRDFREVGSMLLKPIRRVKRRLREIELNGTGIMVGLRQGHQARANEQEHQESGRGSGRECKTSPELQYVRRTRPCK